MAHEVGEIRRSQVIHVFGPGSIVDMRVPGGTVSGIHMGLEEWERGVYEVDEKLEEQTIRLRRLKPLTGRSEFRLPPVVLERAYEAHSGTAALLLKTFPTWLQCPRCSYLKKVDKWEPRQHRDQGKISTKPGLICPKCSTRRDQILVFPARFIVACKDGHIDDFPWNWFVGHKNDSCSGAESLKLASVGPGLSGLILSCDECSASTNMDGIFRKEFLANRKCNGNMPWIVGSNGSCELTGANGDFRVLQRAGSNVYYPELVTALDIPPGSRFDELILESESTHFSEILAEDRLEYLRRFAPQRTRDRLAKFYSGSIEEFVEEYNKNEGIDLSQELRIAEFHALGNSIKSRDLEFWTDPQFVPENLKGFVEKLVKAPKLREVRVLTGFTRILPSTDPNHGKIARLSSGDLPWLPGIEVRGEGIFFQLNQKRLEAWEKQEDVIKHVQPVVSNWKSQAGKKTIEPTARLLLLHTLAHALIKQLTLESGYSSASIRERLFYNETEVAPGVLIYTGSPDSEGTMGGLQVQGDSQRFANLLMGSLESSEWCSSDPLCLDAQLSGANFFSLASCHSCVMLPETSCELHNLYLDRALLVGSLENPSISFFDGWRKDG